MSGGRLWLGIGVGWNGVEYEALGEDFHNRGRRSEEQIEVLRLLWTQELVTFHGRWHKITDAGINPLPVQRPIPLWIGGMADVVIRRIARLADGWMPQGRADDRLRALLDRMCGYAREAARTPNEIGVDGRVNIARRSPEEWAADLAAWRDVRATHASVTTTGAGLASPDGHIDAIRAFKEATADV